MTTPGNDVQTTMYNSPPLGHLLMARDSHRGNDAASNGGPSSYRYSDNEALKICVSRAAFPRNTVPSHAPHRSNRISSGLRNPFSLHPLGLDSEYS